MGNFNHNLRVLEMKKGELKVICRPGQDVDKDPSNYLPCQFCHGFFQKKDLYRHTPKCPFVDPPYGKFTHDFTYEIFICEIVMWNGNNSYMKISYVKSISHMKVSHMKSSYVKSEQFIFICEIFTYESFTYEIFICGIGPIHI